MASSGAALVGCVALTCASGKGGRLGRGGEQRRPCEGACAAQCTSRRQSVVLVTVMMVN